MLTDLLIKNYALIEQLKMKPHESLNIITGETGAGKSIMLGAIGLLLGKRADLKALFNQGEKCIVEGVFLISSYNLQYLFEQLDLDYDDHTSIRREISPNGKSRAFINDTPVTLDSLRRVGTHLIDIHSQHDNLLLGDHLYQLKITDSYAKNQTPLEKYSKKYTVYIKIKQQYEKLQQEQASFQKEYDYNSFLLEELQNAAFQEGEQEALENELKLLESAEEIKTKLNHILDFLSNAEPAVNDELKGMVNSLGQIADLSENLQSFRDRLDSCVIELQDITSEMAREEELIEYSPESIAEAQERLSLLYNLQQKHQVSSLKELLEVQQDLEDKVNKVLHFDKEIDTLKEKLTTSYQDMMKSADKLSHTRKAVIKPIEKILKTLLADLGMPHATIKITQEKTAPTAQGVDLINFLFSGNKGVDPQEISKVASGGEFSRLMLSIKYLLAGKTSLPTIIFDEIDTGISGEIALKMGNMFKEMSKKHQIISISHLHQIAAKGNHHYFVYKDNSAKRSVSRIRQLSPDERVYEIAQMISGATPSKSAILSAKELLES